MNCEIFNSQTWNWPLFWQTTASTLKKKRIIHCKLYTVKSAQVISCIGRENRNAWRNPPTIINYTQGQKIEKPNIFFYFLGAGKPKGQNNPNNFILMPTNKIILQLLKIFYFNILQVLLNMRLQSTSGQATGSVCIAMIGKTTDFFATNILVMPFQYVIMCYFSSSVAYVNGFQVAWYYGQDDVIQPNDEPQSLNTKQLDRNQSEKSSLSVTAYNDQLEFRLNSTSTSNLTPTVQSNKSSCILICRVFCMALITCLLLMCIIGFVLNVHSFYGLFAPTSIGLILGTAYTYYTKCKRSSYHIPNN